MDEGRLGLLMSVNADSRTCPESNVRPPGSGREVIRLLAAQMCEMPGDHSVELQFDRRLQIRDVTGILRELADLLERHGDELREMPEHLGAVGWPMEDGMAKEAPCASNALQQPIPSTRLSKTK